MLGHELMPVGDEPDLGVGVAHALLNDGQRSARRLELDEPTEPVVEQQRRRVGVHAHLRIDTAADVDAQLRKAAALRLHLELQRAPRSALGLGLQAARVDGGQFALQFAKQSVEFGHFRRNVDR